MDQVEMDPTRHRTGGRRDDELGEARLCAEGVAHGDHRIGMVNRAIDLPRPKILIVAQSLGETARCESTTFLVRRARLVPPLSYAFGDVSVRLRRRRHDEIKVTILA